jgi:hypothetical protein
VRKLGLLLVVVSVITMAACGGGGSSNPVSSITSVTVSCTPGTVNSGGTSQCSAAVVGTGSFSTGVTFSATAGQITSAGVFTAPVVTATLVVTVTATSTQDTSKSGTATVTVNPTTSGNNIAQLVVDSGPPGVTGIVNIPYTTVTVCVPGTTNCQTIDHVEVDTGSSGLRLIQGVLTLSLPQSSDSNGNPLDECLVFLDGYVWGPVVTANVTVGGESASNVPTQIMIPSSGSPAVPSSCSNQTTGGNDADSVSTFGANGLIGVGLFQQDCGLGCTTLNPTPPPFYYACNSSGCNPTYATLTQQLPNPVIDFPVDNNGVLIELPSVPDDGSPSVPGSLIFGIGTQSNNQLGSVQIYNVPDSGNNAGSFTTVFNGTSYPDSFIDSGSNGLFFLDSSVPGVPPTCTDQTDWYCPTSPDSLSAGNQGTNMTAPVTVNFTIDNFDTLSNSGNFAFSTSGGPQTGSFDWGLSFFFGRNLFTAIDTMSTPGGPGPYWAY